MISGQLEVKFITDNTKFYKPLKSYTVSGKLKISLKDFEIYIFHCIFESHI